MNIVLNLSLTKAVSFFYLCIYLFIYLSIYFLILFKYIENG